MKKAKIFEVETINNNILEKMLKQLHMENFNYLTNILIGGQKVLKDIKK